MRGWPIFIVVLIGVFAVFYRIDTQDVFIYPEADDVSVTSAAPGAATVAFDNVYSCIIFEVRQRTPDYKFEVLTDGGE